MTDIAEDTPTTGQKFAAEVLGTFVLVFFGVGTAVMSGGDYLSTGFAFGLTVVVMAYAVGRVSGGHFNPAVTVGAALGGRLPWSATPVYVGAQLLGALVAGALLFGLLHGFEGYTAEGNIGANSYGDQGSGYAVWAAFLLEMLLTAVFIWVILAVTDARNEFQAFMGPLAIGFALAMIHLASMAATGTSVNPARSIGVGVFGGTDAILQLWLFILAPTIGAAVAGLTYPLLFGHGSEPVPGSGLSFGGGRKQQAMYAPPSGYEQQWNQGQPQHWQPAPPAQHWGGHDPYAPPPATPPQGQPQAQPQAQPGQAAPPQQWGPPAPQQQPGQWGQQQPPAAPPQGQPQHWGQPHPDDDGEDGRTQVRRPD
ncbi:MIP/aquaporin family protein [Nocardioides sediminis]|uniref:MIP/aquaporin family protein n=1 Tax=Nocardioides sediminis TaxID=433648 RepID=UPI000D30CF3E|nr:aquaporin [Nocardioides sediminis]